MNPDKWPGYNSDEDRRRPDIDALRDVFWGRQQERPTYYMGQEFRRDGETLGEAFIRAWDRTYGKQGFIPPTPVQPGVLRKSIKHSVPVKPFDSAAEADEFHADVARFLKGGGA